MNAYFMNITKDERENILDKHKSLYDGYAVRTNPPSEQPLHTLDLAGDKGGITIDNQGNVGQYNNKIYMKESKGMCEQCGMGEMVEGECSECGYKKYDMEEDIHDVEDLNPKNKFDYVEVEEDAEFLPKEMSDEKLNESVNKTLEWFQKFKKYN